MTCLCVLQKWQCVEDAATGKLRLFKCKSDGVKAFQRGGAGGGRLLPLSVKSQLYRQQWAGCRCDLADLLPLSFGPSVIRPFSRKPFFSKKSECDGAAVPTPPRASAAQLQSCEEP